MEDLEEQVVLQEQELLLEEAVEAVVDLVTKERRPLAKKAKDAAAGAVLIAAIMSAIIGGIIFLPKIMGVIM